jgi:radical SAM superfamily enzyme YgiQ (UPF0313 family)
MFGLPVNHKTAGFYKINPEALGKGWFELGPIRPPSEGKDCSLLIRVIRNCPWNRCEFCRTYKGERFSYRSAEEIIDDINIVKSIAEEIKKASWAIGFGGKINEKVITVLIDSNPEIYHNYNDGLEIRQQKLNSLISVANWLSSGGRTVFLQDADAPQMRTPGLLEVLKYLKDNFPDVERITSYTRSKTMVRKTAEELQQLQQAGLTRLHIGLESGCDEVLKEMKKGVSGEEHIIAGKKIREAGISLSEYYMPGLGGRKYSEKHAIDSAYVLNEINPDFIRIRSLVPRQGSPLHERVQTGEFELLSEDEVISEIGLFVENLKCSSYLASDQMCNLLWEIEGQLPKDKPTIIKIINNYLQKPLWERLKMQLERRLYSYLAICGHLNENFNFMIKEANTAINTNAPDAQQKVDVLLAAVKPAFI